MNITITETLLTIIITAILYKFCQMIYKLLRHESNIRENTSNKFSNNYDSSNFRNTFKKTY